MLALPQAITDSEDKQAGHADRLTAYQKKALELVRLGHTYADIAIKISDEFKLERVPCIATVHNRIQKGDLAYTQDIAHLRYTLRLEQFNRLEAFLVNKRLPLAMADHLKVTRWKMVEGEPQPDLDENAIQEQLDATSKCVSIMARQAKLLGLDLQQAVPDDKKDGPKTHRSCNSGSSTRLTIRHPESHR